MADRVVAERFRLIEPLGRGGMGTVWRAQDQVLGRTVALKEVSLPPSLPDSERKSMRERVLREARAAARLNHSSAVTVFDVLEDGDYTFIAMEMVDSPTLAQVVQEQGPLSPERAAFIGMKLLDTLEAAHAKGIVHRDVKPANVMVSDRFVKLADFGIASVKGDPQLTATGLLLGSPSYMSPEQVSGEPAGPASDLWALGATLYFAVEGRGPFDREGPLPTLMAISNEAAPEPLHAGPVAPAIKGLLEKEPARRATPERLRSILQPIADSGQLVAAPALEIPAEEDAVEKSPNGIPAFLPPEAPAVLAEFIARHDAEEDSDGQVEPEGTPAPSAEVQKPDPPAEVQGPEPLAAVPDIETTWQDELPEAPSATVPVTKAEPRQSAATRTAPARPVPSAVPEERNYTNWAVAGGLIALLLFAILVIPRLLSSPSEDQPSAESTNSAQGTTAEDAAPAPAQPGGTPEAQAGGGTQDQAADRQEQVPETQQEATERPPAQARTETVDSDAVPSGWRTAALGDTGHRIAHPPSWSVRNNALGDGSSVRINGPQGKYLLVDWTNRPGSDALAAWEQQAASFAQRHQNYREIRLERSRFQDFPTAAIWEWTYTQNGAQLHAINLGFADDDYGFALNFQTRASDWASSQDELEAFKASFGER